MYCSCGDCCCGGTEQDDIVEEPPLEPAELAERLDAVESDVEVAAELGTGCCGSAGFWWWWLGVKVVVVVIVALEECFGCCWLGSPVPSAVSAEGRGSLCSSAALR